MKKINVRNIFIKIKSDYRHVICLSITVMFFLLSFFYFKNSFPRIIEGITDIFNSLKYYINEMFKTNFSTTVTVNYFSKLPLELPFNLPNTWSEFKELLSIYFDYLFNSQNFINYIKSLCLFFLNLSRVLTLGLPLLLIFILVSGSDVVNNDYNKYSKPLKIYKKIELKFFYPIKLWVYSFINFIKNNKIYKRIWILIWMYNFQIFTIILEAVAFYLYFVVSFDFLSIYKQVLKLLLDLSIMLDFVPLIVWIIYGLYSFNKFRCKIGYSMLQHYEFKDRGLINSLAIILFLWGTMGSKKTTIVTDMALSEEIMLRDKALELMLELDLQFPNFPWINLERFIQGQMKKRNKAKKGKPKRKKHNIYNLASIEYVIRKMKVRFMNNPNFKNIFDYDFIHYGFVYNNHLSYGDVWDAIEDYAKLYFIYICESSLIISNYSIRSDNYMESLGNFPIWNTDLFKRNPVYQSLLSRHAHILDFDMLRLGKKVVANNRKANCFEFGVITITEIAKERLNALELQGIKKNDSETNQKNDLFNSWLKMVRHSSTVCNYPFVKIITDDQRPESWGADARDLCQLINVIECSDLKLTIPFFEFEELFISSLLAKFKDKYYDHRYKRGDITLKMYLYKMFISFLYNYQKKYHNIFGYYKLDVDIESGTQNGNIKQKNYYLMLKKIYSNRFSTDCFSEYFRKKAIKSDYSLNSLDEFNDIKATYEEMLKENSYFFKELIKIFNDNNSVS